MPTDNRGYLIFVIPPYGELKLEHSRKLPDYKAIQKWVDGTFQIIPYFSKLTVDGVDYKRGTAYCNEESFLKGMTRNERAEEAWKKSCPNGDPRRMRLEGPVAYIVKEPKADVSEG